MKYFYSLIIMFSLFFSYAHISPSPTKANRSVSEFCEHVHRHKCFVRLLRKSIRILKQKNYYYIIAENVKNNTIKDTNIEFAHPFIQSALKQIKQVKNLSPLFKLWRELIQYKYIDDTLITKEFAQIILYLSKNLLITQMQQKKYTKELLPQINEACDSALSAEITQIIQFINLCTDSYELMQEHVTTNLDELWNNPISKIIEIQASEKNLYTEQCTIIYFFIQRLKYTYLLAKKLHKTNPKIFNKKIDFDTKINYTDVRIKRCQTEMYYSKSLLPILHLWEEFNEYRYLNNPIFLQEFLCLTLGVEKHLVLTISAEQKKKFRIPIGHILALYNNIENLSIDELLNGIDAVSEILPEIIEHYELNGDMTWKDWAKKYWWIPVSVVAIGSKYIYNKFIKKTPQITPTTPPQLFIPTPPSSTPPRPNTQARPTHQPRPTISDESDEELDDLETLLNEDSTEEATSNQRSQKRTRNRSSSVVMPADLFKEMIRKRINTSKIQNAISKLRNSKRHQQSEKPSESAPNIKPETRPRSHTIQPGTHRPNFTEETKQNKPRRISSIGTPRERLPREQLPKGRDRTLSVSAKTEDGRSVELKISKSELKEKFNLDFSSSEEEQSLISEPSDLAPQPSTHTTSSENDLKPTPSDEPLKNETKSDNQENTSDKIEKKHSPVPPLDLSKIPEPDKQDKKPKTLKQSSRKNKTHNTKKKK